MSRSGESRRGIAAIVVAALISVGLTAVAAPLAAVADTPTPPAVMDEYPVAEYSAEAEALPDELVESLDRDLGKTGAEYLAEADAAADGVVVVDGLASIGVDVLGSHMEDSTLVVNVPQEDVPLVEAAGGRAEVGAPEEFDSSGLEFAPMTDIRGGTGYTWQVGSSGFQCSIGFPGYSVANGARWLSTAGHCVAEMVGIAGQVDVLVQSTPGSGGSVGAHIGLPVTNSATFGNGYDGALIAASAPSLVVYPEVVTWGGGAGAPMANSPISITGQTAGIIGASLCKSGSRSGWTCGTIVAVDQTVNVAGHLVNSILATTCLLPGDSGGAAFVGTLAAAIDSSASGSNCGAEGYYAGFFPLVSGASKASIQAQYGTGWELAVSVATPAIGLVSGGSTGSPGYISGTLAGATASNRVAIYLDGSATALTTVPVVSGQWTASLTGASAGLHTFSAVAIAGTWSRSAPASGAFSVTLTPLTPGTLVKSPTVPTVYLVDGSSTLVPLGSFATMTDGGHSTAYSVVAAEQIASYTIAASPLRNLLLCSGTTYLAAEGKLWPLDNAVVGSAPVTSLSANTCATFPTTVPTTIQGAVFLTPISGGTIYTLAANGQKRPLLTMATLGMLSSPYTPVYLHVNDYYLGTLPTGPSVIQPASLVKSSTAATVYFADGFGSLIPLLSFANATDAGASATYYTVPVADLVGMTVRGTPMSNSIDCSGTRYFSGSGSLWPITPSFVAGLPTTTLTAIACAQLPKNAATIDKVLFVRSPSNSTVYAINASGTRQAALTMSTLAYLSAPSAYTLATVGDQFLATLPIGVPLTPSGILVKSSSSPIVSLVDGATNLVPLRTFESVSDLGLSTGYGVVAPSVLSGRTSSSAVLSNLVSCAGTTLLGAGGTGWAIPTTNIGALPVSTLDSTVCALIPRGTTSGGPVFFKPASAPTIYQLSNGTKRAVTSWATLVALSPGGVVTYYTLNDPYVASIPTGTPITGTA